MTDKLKQFLPADVTNRDEVDQIYSMELFNVAGGFSFERFLYKWDYWMDDSIRQRKLKASDWEWIQPLLFTIRSDIRVKKADLSDNKFRIPLALAVPNKILMVSLQAQRFKVPWGLAYHQLRKAKAINF